MKKHIIAAIAWSMALYAQADKLPVKNITVAGPYTATAAIQIDTIDASGNKYDDNDFLKNGIMPQVWKNGQQAQMITDKDGNPAIELKAGAQPTVFVAGFTFDNLHFAKCNVKVGAKQSSTTYIDNKEGGNQNLTPGRHEVAIKLLCKANETDTLTLHVESEQSDFITINAEGKRPYTLADYMNGEKGSTTSLSANGRYLMMNSRIIRNDGNTEWRRHIIDLKTGTKTTCEGFDSWATNDDRYIRTRKGVQGETIYEYVDPSTGASNVFFTNYMKLRGSFLPGEKEMLISQSVDGPREDAQVHQILEPDDRQPGWRNRTNVQLLNIQSGQLTQLTAGHHNSGVSISLDGKLALITSHEDKLTERPFTFTNIYLYNRETQKLDTLVRHDGFVTQAEFLTDNKNIVITGSPEAFGGIGINDPTGKTPSMIQTELFLMNLDTKQVHSLTRDFDPNILSFEVSEYDGCVYMLCENRDRKDVYRLNPKTEKIEPIKLTECYVGSISLARNKPVMSYTGQSDSNADRVYTVDLKTGKETLIHDFNATRMDGIALGKCEDWDFINSRGDKIYGRYYLPPHFDENKKYPMLVYYYGGCSPTGRYLESYYNFHGWAAMGYVVYVVQPSGCTGFGQEFAARHVNTYGEGTADDIIEGTKKFCLEHPYVNKDKIGCLGASYGGFMTQFLMTKTDIFAAAMSHAGISNPTSYWGYGYWGYSYSTISAANSYPWNNEKLLSGQAPLFNADKVHTPILFLHGAADTNVPINESIQMFTALKLLGRECAFVVVEGQDHHILDYNKQIKWVNTYYAWFAKWLQDDPTWWDTMYPKKNL